ncbi:MAG: ADP-glyceromanno-heptose 6-epimerase [Bacteriovoracaceae bacterium]|nr:ADP-glyceromanno-heptose 6-epimerase [Bacteriovoracaceae bacterium]
MILVTGGAGFIGSALIHALNREGHQDIIVVDWMGSDNKWLNLRGLKFLEIVSPDDFWVEEKRNRFKRATAIFHMGACSSTTEKDGDFLYRNNFKFSTILFDHATYNNIPFFYASSAATYGNGELGYDDDVALIPRLRPLNPYGFSKQLFDAWVMEQKHGPPVWNGFKFFNVFGPNEYHKGDMSSVAFKAFHQIKASGSVKLFKSHHKDFSDGGQIRDFIYIKDVIKVMIHLFKTKLPENNGIFNLGTGKGRTFLDFVSAVFQAQGLAPKIEYIDMPMPIRSQYQYFTQASTERLLTKLPAGFSFATLEDSVQDYVKNYLMHDTPYFDFYVVR